MSEVRSMTGFASIDGSLADAGGVFTLSIKSVNHRHLDLALRMPPNMEAVEAALRAAVRAEVRRGHVELTLNIERSTAAIVHLDEAVLSEYARVFHQASASLHVHQTLDLNAMLRLPGVLTSAPVRVDASALEPALVEAAATLLMQFNSSRAAEGEALAKELRAAMHRLLQLVEEAAQLRVGTSAAEIKRLRARLEDLLATADLNEERLLMEAGLLAARSDIDEELVRLRTHIARFLELLDQGGEAGRPLDFLLQEMNREANTALSKGGSNAGQSGLRLTEIGLAIKVELERVREQVQNLE